MKRFLSTVLAIIIGLLACISISAETPVIPSNVYEIDHVTVIFEENSTYTPEEKQYIAELLVYGENAVFTYGIACLFGHKYVEESVTTITHCVNDTQPRCLQEYFLVKTCSRCGKATTERINYLYITCCP